MIQTAVSGAENYVEAGETENEVMQDTVDYIDSVVASIKGEDTSGGSSSSGELATTTISASNYGDKIEYSANGVTDWKIFYNDGTNVYIIASDYLDNSLIPASASMETYNTYIACFGGSTWGATDLTNAKEGFLFTKLSSVTSTNANYYATATLLDTNIWSDFVDASCATYAIGSPTVEMWTASWNAKGYTKLNTAVDSTGYYIGTDTTPTSTYVDLSSETAYTEPDTLYFPHTSSYSSCYGYWLASPSALDDTAVYFSTCYGEIFGSDDFSTTVYALRPVICLTSDVTLTYDTDTWIIG